MSQVSNGFWIGVKFPDTLIEMFTFQFTGNLEGTHHINNWIAGIYGIIFCIYIIYCVIKNKKATNKQKLEPAKLSIIYGLVILGSHSSINSYTKTNNLGKIFISCNRFTNIYICII